MITSEIEYYLLCELITMPDRVLAQQIELLIWARSPIPQESILEKFLSMLMDAEDAQEFHAKCREYVDSFEIGWHVSIVHEDKSVLTTVENACKIPSPTITVFKEN